MQLFGTSISKKSAVIAIGFAVSFLVFIGFLFFMKKNSNSNNKLPFAVPEVPAKESKKTEKTKKQQISETKRTEKTTYAVSVQKQPIAPGKTAEQRYNKKTTHIPNTNPATPPHLPQRAVGERFQPPPPILQNSNKENINGEDIKKIILEAIKKDPQLKLEIVKAIIGFKNFSNDVVDIDTFEAKKAILQRDVELYKLLLQKAKLQAEYRKLLGSSPNEQKLLNQLARLQLQMQNLLKEVNALKAEVNGLKSGKIQRSKEEKISTREKTAKNKSEALKKYLGTFTSTAKIGNEWYVFDKKGNYYTEGDFLEDGTKIVKVKFNKVLIKTPEGKEIWVPVGKTSTQKSGAVEKSTVQHPIRGLNIPLR